MGRVRQPHGSTSSFVVWPLRRYKKKKNEKTKPNDDESEKWTYVITVWRVVVVIAPRRNVLGGLLVFARSFEFSFSPPVRNARADGDGETLRLIYDNGSGCRLFQRAVENNFLFFSPTRVCERKSWTRGAVMETDRRGTEERRVW